MLDKDVVLVVAPHPDDETLGCGGTLLRARAAGSTIHWLIMTEIPVGDNVGGLMNEKRAREIRRVSEAYGFESVAELRFPTLCLDVEPRHDVVRAVGAALDEVKPGIALLPWHGDAHSDHRVTFESVQACLKSFRAPWLRKAMAYEVLSETNFNLDRASRSFDPTDFISIDGLVERKIEIMKFYSGQVEDYPFPRSPEAIRALAVLRGSQANRHHAEGFVPLFSVI